MRSLVIAGAGGFGREVLSWLRAALADDPAVVIRGFLDDDPHALDGLPAGIPIVGTVAGYMAAPGEEVVVAVGNPRAKLEVGARIKATGATLYTLIHPTAVVGAANRIGAGSILCPYAVVTTGVVLGELCTLNVAASVGHDARLGDGCTLSGHADVTGFAQLGRGVFLGSHAVVLPGAHVGDFAVVGAGSVVLRSVAPGATVIGVPAKQVYAGRTDP